MQSINPNPTHMARLNRFAVGFCTFIWSRFGLSGSTYGEMLE